MPVNLAKASRGSKEHGLLIGIGWDEIAQLGSAGSRIEVGTTVSTNLSWMPV